MYLKLLACEIMVREVCHVVSRAPHICDVAFLDQGFHDRVDEGRAALQAAIDGAAGRGYDAILLGYGLCNNLIAGLEARDVPLVVPRAHDCITIFLGSREEYDRQFSATPGTYYYTSGWLECGKRRGDGGGALMPAGSQMGGGGQYEQWVEQYGEDKARALLEVTAEWTAHYTHGVLIDFEFTRHLGLDKAVRQICDERGWTFEQVEGDPILLQRLLDGDWTESDYLIIPPGRRVSATFDDRIIGHACSGSEAKGA